MHVQSPIAGWGGPPQTIERFPSDFSGALPKSAVDRASPSTELGMRDPRPPSPDPIPLVPNL